MREIKFRAYIKNKNIMTEVKSLHLGTRKVIIGYSESGTNFGNYSVSFGDIKLMQYTGLKDRNGKEIYEGDILAVDNIIEDEMTSRHLRTICVVYFNEEAGAYYIKDVTQNDEYSIEHFIDEVSYDFSIIGNIYDNPELLGG